MNTNHRADPVGFARILARVIETGARVIIDGDRVEIEAPADLLPDLIREARPFKRSLRQVFRDSPPVSKLPGVH